MAGRRALLVANWKMNLTRSEAAAWVSAIGPEVSGAAEAEVVVAPSFLQVAFVVERLAGTGIGVAAQDCHPAASGAFTGEVSAEMIRDAGARAVIVGHSERRRMFGEDDVAVAAKARAARRAGLVPIVCVGETLEERDAGVTERVLEARLEGALGGAAPWPSEDAPGLVVAYEPVWAIGTGRNATPEEAHAALAFIRGWLGSRLGAAAASGARLLYGGSVTPGNARDLARSSELDGALVGGASLDPALFGAIVRVLAEARRARL